MALLEIPQLNGEWVRLEPLRIEHAEQLSAACEDGQLYDIWYTKIPSPATMATEINRRLGLCAAGTMLPFTTIEQASNRLIGMTSIMNMRLENFKVEIGSTWLAKSFQGTAINPEAKMLMLDYAFSSLKCNAVEFRTHEKNLQSRAAIEKLGAKLDGILRNDMVMANGNIRNTVVYSITIQEWPEVKENLISRLGKLRGLQSQ